MMRAKGKRRWWEWEERSIAEVDELQQSIDFGFRSSGPILHLAATKSPTCSFFSSCHLALLSLIPPRSYFSIPPRSHSLFVHLVMARDTHEGHEVTPRYGRKRSVG